MNLFTKIFGKKKEKKWSEYYKTLTAYKSSFRNFGGEIYESELCRSAIDTRARHISKLKVEILGSAKPELQTQLRKDPNSFMTWSQFLYRTSTILDMQNTAFIVPILGKYGETIGLFPVLPSKCEVVNVSGEPWLRYTFNNGETASIEFSSVGIMTKFQYGDDFFGNDNTALNETLQLITIQNQGIEEAIKNSATYRFMARLANFSKNEDLVKERKRFSEENLSKDASAGGLLLFPNTYGDIKQLESKPYTVNAAQMELIRTNVFNYYAVNADVIQNKAYGDAWSAFYEGCVEVFAIQFSEVMTKMLFTPKERANGAGVIATSNRLQYMSNTDKLNMASAALDRGLMTINETRDMFNLGPLEGGDVTIMRGEYKNGNEINKKEGSTEE